MSKLDKIFEKVVSDPLIAQKYNIKQGKFTSVFQGAFAMDPHVKYIARVLSNIDKEVEDVKSNMRQNYQSEAVKLTRTQMMAIYKVSLPVLTAESNDD